MTKSIISSLSKCAGVGTGTTDGTGATVTGAGVAATGVGAADTGVGAGGIGDGVVATGVAATGRSAAHIVWLNKPCLRNGGYEFQGWGRTAVPASCDMLGAIRLRRRANIFPTRPISTIVALALAALPLPAFAYSCAISPAKDAVIVKTDNGRDRAVTCKIDCVFNGQDGSVTISCSQQIPAGAKSWYVCLRPTGGKALEYVSGTESCD